MSTRSVTVYCSSSDKLAPVYYEAARALGQALAAADWQLIYGGNDCGLMGAVANAARLAGGRVVGITPQVLVDKGLADHRADELIITANMRQRKAILEEKADAFIALPGGFGTFEELFEIIVGRQLGYHDKPIVILNVNNYYEPLLTMIEHGVDQQFIKPSACDAYAVFTDVSACMQYLTDSLLIGTPHPQPLEPSALE